MTTQKGQYKFTARTDDVTVRQQCADELEGSKAKQI